MRMLPFLVLPRRGGASLRCLSNTSCGALRSLPDASVVSKCEPGQSSMRPFSSLAASIAMFIARPTGGCATSRSGQS